MTLATLAPWMVLVAGALMLALGVYVLWRAHYDRHNPINLAYALLDGTLHPPRVTLAKIVGLGAFLASTWWITWLNQWECLAPGISTDAQRIGQIRSGFFGGRRGVPSP